MHFSSSDHAARRASNSASSSEVSRLRDVSPPVCFEPHISSVSISEFVVTLISVAYFR